MMKINNDHEFMAFAMHQYSNPQLTNIDEFQKDIGRICLIKKSIDRYLNDNNINLRLLLNHFVVLGNVFSKGIVPIMEYKFQDDSNQHKSTLKSIFIFLGWIEPNGMNDVESDAIMDTMLSNLGDN